VDRLLVDDQADRLLADVVKQGEIDVPDARQAKHGQERDEHLGQRLELGIGVVPSASAGGVEETTVRGRSGLDPPGFSSTSRTDWRSSGARRPGHPVRGGHARATWCWPSACSPGSRASTWGWRRSALSWPRWASAWLRLAGDRVELRERDHPAARAADPRGRHRHLGDMTECRTAHTHHWTTSIVSHHT